MLYVRVLEGPGGTRFLAASTQAYPELRGQKVAARSYPLTQLSTERFDPLSMKRFKAALAHESLYPKFRQLLVETPLLAQRLRL